eukprot:gene6493-8292_t
MQLWDEIAASPARVTVIGATNRPQDLDAAIQRRFERSFLIGMPNEQDRARIIKILLRGIPVHPRFDYGHAARMTDRYTPSDLVSVCKAAAFIPLNEYRVNLQRAERISREKALAVDEAMKSKEFERKEQTEGSSLIEHHGPSEGCKDGIRDIEEALKSVYPTNWISQSYASLSSSSRGPGGWDGGGGGGGGGEGSSWGFYTVVDHDADNADSQSPDED